MANTWILDSETKGTGAHMVPLEKARKPRGPEEELALVRLERPPRQPKPAEPKAKRLFKVVDVMSASVLAEDIDARGAVELLDRSERLLDLRIYVWQPAAGRWRLLTLGEQRTLWRFRPRSGTGGRSRAG